MKISVVMPCLVVNENLFKELQRAVSSIKEADVEIIIVDNGSTVGSFWMAENADIYIRYPDKIGFGKACNQGLKLASGDYLAICSIDDEYLSGGLQILADIYQQNEPEIGVICPSMVNKSQIQQDKMFLDQTEGSTFLFSRKVYNKVKLRTGLYDERFKHGYFEDRDLWERLKRAGYILVRSGHVLARHGEGTTNKYLGVLDKYMEINKKKFIEKWGFEPDWMG